MKLKRNDFGDDRYPRLEVISETDSGLLAVQYDLPPKPQKAQLVSDSYNWRYSDGNDCYTLVIPQAKQRNVLRSVTIVRTSVNYYDIAYADTMGCVITTVKSLVAVHEFLTPLWKRRLKNDTEKK